MLYDDREKERLGVKLADAELIGIPHRLLITEKGIDAGTLEYKGRRDADPTDVAITELTTFLQSR